ncbi:BACON domain-containing protein [Actinacidiphila paucisporea]|uniref:DNA-directed RNA polymerase specialized sigma subunit, sigma24 family n=1 Tax=Actinacidiphila paucisporea TaxID=310782 RepID=A0A1M7PHT7_9ACTN|nr:sigma-70 family RNA polymerase sigma factor [Actinacidiphila paucisporea]SHN16599.1 DNA-directed RNA polymerase specialized sigma subunit, sigma24 family [Actinacidiphila paucisporea]
MSRQETPTPSPQTTGAHRRHRAAGSSRSAARAAARSGSSGPSGDGRERDGVRRRPQGTLPMVPPAHYEPYLDGLYTYCLSVLCEHDAAAGALGEVIALAERQRSRLRDPALRRPWLYALARWSCLRRLAAGTPLAPVRAATSVADQRAAQLAALAWPEAAGTTPEQREALELAVRHQLPPHEVAAVLGLETDAARGLLARAACEVERTRAALAVVDTGHCASLARLAADTKVLLGPALRDELVRHVDECTLCRRTAERAVAAGPWPGATADATAVLALIEAPRAAACAALLHAMEAGAGRSRECTPRFDRRGFPLDLKDRAARRAQLRHRALTTTVVAAVVAAPVLAVWAAYRATPLGGDDAHHGPGRAAAGAPDGVGFPYEKAGAAHPGPSDAGRPAAPTPPGEADVTAVTVTPSGAPSPSPGAGHLTVTAAPAAGRTLVTLTASGSADVHWSATTTAGWLRLSATSGVLHPGQSATLSISVVRSLAPAGSWTASVTFAPADTTLILRGSHRRSVPPPTDPPPSSPPPTSTTPSPTPPPTTPPPTTEPPTDTPTPSATATSP